MRMIKLRHKDDPFKAYYATGLAKIMVFFEFLIESADSDDRKHHLAFVDSPQHHWHLGL